MNIGLVKEADKEGFWEEWLRENIPDKVQVFETRPLRNGINPDMGGFANFMRSTDFVIVDTGFQHLRVAEILIKNLKHTLISLPRVISLPDLRKHLQLAGETRSIVWYYHPYEVTAEAGEQLASIGEIQHIELLHDLPYGGNTDLRQSVIRDLCLVQQLTNWPVKRISTESLAFYAEFPGFIKSRLDYINGTHAYYQLNLLKNSSLMQTRVFGHHHYLELNLNGSNICPMTIRNPESGQESQRKLSLFADACETAASSFYQFTNLVKHQTDFNNCEQKLLPFRMANEIINKILPVH